MSLQDVLLNLCGTVIPIITLKCLFLKPEGVEQYFSQTLFLEMEPEKRNKSTALSFSFPPNVVPGSQRARVVLAGKSAVCPLTVRACSLFTLSHLGMYHSRKASVGIFLSYRFQVQLVLIVSCRINVSSCRTAASCSVRLFFFFHPSVTCHLSHFPDFQGAHLKKILFIFHSKVTLFEHSSGERDTFCSHSGLTFQLKLLKNKHVVHALNLSILCPAASRRRYPGFVHQQLGFTGSAAAWMWGTEHDPLCSKCICYPVPGHFKPG